MKERFFHMVKNCSPFFNNYDFIHSLKELRTKITLIEKKRKKKRVAIYSHCRYMKTYITLIKEDLPNNLLSSSSSPCTRPKSENISLLLQVSVAAGLLTLFSLISVSPPHFLILSSAIEASLFQFVL